MKSGKWKLSVEIFLQFFRIGMFTFGSGWSILAQLEQLYVDKKGLMTKGDLLELTTVGKSVPGVMITNVSMLIGYQLAGVPGGICAVLGLTAPAILILTVVTRFYNFFKDNPWVSYAMRGIGGAVVAIIASAALSLGKEALKDKIAILLCLVAFVLSVFLDVSSLLLIVSGVLRSLLWMGIRMRKEKNGGGEDP